MLDLKQFYKQVFSVGGLQFLSLPMGVLASVFLARGLGPDLFGQYAFLMSVASIVSIPVMGGVSQYLVREVASFKYDKQWQRYKSLKYIARKWVVISTSVCGLFVVFISLLFDKQAIYSMSSLFVLIFIVLVQGLVSVENGVLRGLGRVMYAEIPSSLIFPAMMLVVYSLLFKYELISLFSVLISQLVILVVTLLIYVILGGSVQTAALYSNDQSSRGLRSFIISLSPFMSIVVVTTLNTQIGVFLLGLLSEDSEVAAMRLAERVAQFIALSLTIVNIVIGPKIVTMVKANELKLLRKLLARASSLAFFMSSIVALLLVLFGEVILSWVFGGEYSSISYLPMVVLIVGQLINVFFGSVGLVLSMSGYEKDTLMGQGVATVVSITICFICIPSMGALGAAIGVSCGLIVWNVLLSFRLKKRLDINVRPF